jgi:hypothetical protein
MIKSPETTSHALRYFRKWATLYKQWEFWAISVSFIFVYFMLGNYDLLPRYFVDQPAVGKILLTSLILTAATYVIKRKQIRLQGHEDWFARLFQPGQSSALPILVSGFLLLAVFGFCFPIFADAQTSQPISGIKLVVQHPIALIAPVLYIISAILFLKSYQSWRITAMLWTVGGYFALIAISIAFTNTDVDIKNGYDWAFFMVTIAPLCAIALSFIPLKSSGAKHPKNRH